MLHKSRIKAEVKKQFPAVEIKEITKGGFGVFSVGVFKHTSRTVKIGILMGETDFDKKENGVLLDKKINWLGSISNETFNAI
jgi:hypothetical protein